MSNVNLNKINIQLYIDNKRILEQDTSHNNLINRIWYYLYKLDQIMLKDNAYDKAREFLEEYLKEPVNNLENIKYNLENPVTGKWSITDSNPNTVSCIFNNYFEFIDMFSLNINHTQSLHLTYRVNLNGKDIKYALSIINFNQNMFNILENRKITSDVKYHDEFINILKYNSTVQQNNLILFKIILNLMTIILVF